MMMLMFFAGFVVFIIIYRYFLREPAFAWFNSIFLTTPSEHQNEVRKENFKSLSTIKSADPELEKKKVIRLLEIGPGTGTNFEYYPNGTHLMIVDSNPSFLKYFNENKKKFEHIECEKVITAKGEEMDMVPDNSCDAVVMTHVMCSVDSVEQILKQIYRVLAPGGRFYFYEHIKEYDSAYWKRNIAQCLFSYSGFWPLVFVGCMLTRDPLKAIGDAGFKSIKHKKMIVRFPQKLMYFVEPHLVGEATK